MADLVAVQLSGPSFAAELERVWGRGDAVLPLDPALSVPQRRRLLDELRPAVLLDDHGSTPLDDPLPCADGMALVVATSGSTGRPKGVELTHDALTASARASLERIGAGPDDRWLCCLPLHHVAGIAVLVRSRLLGTQPLLQPRFDPPAVARATQATHVSLVPTMLLRLLEAGVDLGHLRAVLLGGAAAPASLIDRARAAGVHVVETYGMTETCGGCVYDGVPLSGVEVSVRDDGRIAFRGPVLARGYRGRPDLDAAAWADGWFVSNDLGRVEGGRLVVTGRADHVIVTGGENVDPLAVEGVLRADPAIADVVVRSRPDPMWGQRVVALCVAADPRLPPQLDALRRRVAAVLPAAAAPRELVLVDALPRTALGKPVRGPLRGDAGASPSDGSG